jgi:hypothetical protein
VLPELLLTVAIASPRVITVANATNAVNGTVTSIDALIASPGSDGISLIEAMAAADQTTGAKVIQFAPSLMGSVISVARADALPRLLTLQSGDLTIDGDVDHDGQPDITVDGGASGAQFVIRSSNNVIAGLTIVNFPQRAIGFSCLDVACAPKTISDITIRNNTIRLPPPSPLYGDGQAIELGALGSVPLSAAPLLSDMTWSNIAIVDNIIEARTSAVGIRPGGAGSSRNRIRNVTVARNRITAVEAAISIAVADENSTGGRATPEGAPTIYSEDNLLEDLIVEDNTIEAGINGISLWTANQGNSRNTMERVRVRRNSVRAGHIALSIGTASETMFRASEGNGVFDVTVEDNVFAGTEPFGMTFGLVIANGDWLRPGPATSGGVRANTIHGLSIARNVVRDFQWFGISAWGGSTIDGGDYVAVENRVTALTIDDNQIDGIASPGPSPACIRIMGGASSALADARGNLFRGAVRGNQTRNCEIGIDILGGIGSGSSANRVVIESLTGNTGTLRVASDREGAVSNEVHLPRRRGVRH